MLKCKSKKFLIETSFSEEKEKLREKNYNQMFKTRVNINKSEEEVLPVVISNKTAVHLPSPRELYPDSYHRDYYLLVHALNPEISQFPY